jgi:alkylation response protein AidB-like acyl-CoA dehydrogenase
MNFDLDEDQQLFRASVERFAGSFDVAARDRMRLGDGGYPKARWREAAELGLLALAARETDGGLGGSPLDLALVAESLGKAIAPDPWLENGVLPSSTPGRAGASPRSPLPSREAATRSSRHGPPFAVTR